MATSLTYLLGTELIVGHTARQMQRVYQGYAGAHGVAVMNLGGRGFAAPIKGKIRVTGASYAQARSNALAAIVAVENLQSLPADTYTYGNDTFYNCIFEGFQLLPGSDSKVFHYTKEGYMTVDYIIIMRGLI